MKSKILLVVLITMFMANFKSESQIASTTNNNVSESNTNNSFVPVTFKNNNLKMAGNLFLPIGFDKNKKYAAIVVVHPGGGVKEQTAGLYAQKLAEAGYVTLAFDASYQG